MEKLIIAGYLSACAAFLTAVLSIVKLVVEKENKTSEFRQQWTNSVREGISDLVAKLNNATSLINYQARLSSIISKLENRLQKEKSDIYEKRLDVFQATVSRVREEISENRHGLFKAFSLCQLHFKQDEEKFKLIESIFDEIMDLNKEVLNRGAASEEKRELNEGAKTKNYDKSQDIVKISRQILKSEWERVKKGEQAFITTKKLSAYGGAIMLIILLGLGYLSYKFSLRTINDSDTITKRVDAHINTVNLIRENNKCWELANVQNKKYKFNRCTGVLEPIE